MTQQTANPLMELDSKCVAGEFGSIEKYVSSLRLATKYVGSCTLLPKPVRIIAAPTPRYSPRTPSLAKIERNPWVAFLYLCCVPTGRNGEYACKRVLTRKNGDPTAAPRTPEEAPETRLTRGDCTVESPYRGAVRRTRIGS